MMLDLDDRLDEALAALATACPRMALCRCVGAGEASMLTRQGDAEGATELLRDQIAERPEQPVLENALAELDAGRTLPPPFAMRRVAWRTRCGGSPRRSIRSEVARARCCMRARAVPEPDLDEATLMIGDVFSEQENFEAAIDTYAEIAEASPISYAGKLRTAGALHEMDRKEQAYELLEHQAEAEPERIQALVQLGNLLRGDEQYARAEQAYTRAMERSDARARGLDPVLRPRHRLRADQAVAPGRGRFPEGAGARARAAAGAQLSGL